MVALHDFPINGLFIQCNYSIYGGCFHLRKIFTTDENLPWYGEIEHSGNLNEVISIAVHLSNTIGKHFIYNHTYESNHSLLQDTFKV